MTVAVDIKTGAVIGQVTDARDSLGDTHIRLLTKLGYIWVSVSHSNIRLEECA